VRNALMTFKALPNRFPVSGGNPTVSWDVNSVTGCTLKRNGVNQLWADLGAVANHVVGSKTDHVTAQTVYSISCAKVGGGTLTASAIVNVGSGFQQF